MTRRSTLCCLMLLGALTIAPTAKAADLPQIKVSAGNPVMACATPGRLMAYVKANNPNMPDRFDVLASEYKRNGEEFGIRWDYVFFQMLVETGFLKFTGDVNINQNNFAGLGATGKGAKGESFADVATGARAHLQHVLMYTGDAVDNPVAQRTRDVQAWGVLTKWQQTIKRPMTFKDLATKWAPTSRGYPRDIISVAERFENGKCKEDDPQPELVADAGEAPKSQPKANTATAETSGKKSKAKADAKPQADAAADTPADDTAKAPPETAAKSQPPGGKGGATGSVASTADAAAGVKALNSPPASEPEAPAAAVAATGKAAEAAPEKKVEVAAVAGDAAKAKVSEPAKGKCKVWQASYGGAKAIIIKATADKMTNYTVLDVNDGSEKREADAYIAAYAKGGATVGEFASPAQALEKAFQMCPEG